MDCPEVYIKDNSLQRKDAANVCSAFLMKMKWASDEVILDVGCGPGDVTTNILYPSLKDKIKQLTGVDKSAEMVEYALKNYKSSIVNFEVLNIENIEDCAKNKDRFNKIFSFFCFHWVQNKVGALFNMHYMLKRGGEILVHFMFANPLVDLYKRLDEEWDCYTKDATVMSQYDYSYDELKSIFAQVGFRILNIEAKMKKYTYPDLQAVLNATKAVDEMYSILPPHLHDKYSEHIKDKICQYHMVSINPSTGRATTAYSPITIHAIKE